MKKLVSENDVRGMARDWFKKNAPEVRVVKIRALGIVGFPDTIIFGPFRRIIFIEFKRPDRWLKRKQQLWFDFLGGVCGFPCYCVNDAQTFHLLLNEEFNA